MAESGLRLLIVDADPDGSRKVGLALDGAGFQVGWSSFSPAELTQMVSGLHPQVLLVHGELSGQQVYSLLGTVTVPVVLLCKDTSDDLFVQSMRTGLVEMLREPFNARAHVAKLRLALAGLADRLGSLQGRGSPKELQALVAHLTRARRTGGLTIGEGRAFFSRGALKAARFREQSMQAALAAMLAAPAAWTFTEGEAAGAGLVDEGASTPASHPAAAPTPFAEPLPAASPSGIGPPPPAAGPAPVGTPP